PQQQVIVDQGNIEVVPAAPDVIYVPVYQPEFVFVRPCPRPGFFISFGVGFRTGVWLNHDFDWRGRHIVVWHHDSPRPRDWWYHPESRHLPAAAAGSASVNIWRPHPQPIVRVDRNGDRGWDIHGS